VCQNMEQHLSQFWLIRFCCHPNMNSPAPFTSERSHNKHHKSTQKSAKIPLDLKRPDHFRNQSSFLPVYACRTPEMSDAEFYIAMTIFPKLNTPENFSKNSGKLVTACKYQIPYAVIFALNLSFHAWLNKIIK